MITAAIVVLVIISLYFYGTRNFKYWEKKGIKHDKPIPFLGNNSKVVFLTSSVTQVANELYWKYPNERVVGFYLGTIPVLMIRDPQLIKTILITDFKSFYERGLIPHNAAFQPFLQNLLYVEGDVWKLLRQTMTPAFTIGKLKAMFPLIVERAERLKAYVLKATSEGKSLDARELMARYSTDLILACGFGLDADSLNDENSAYRRFGRKIFQLDVRNVFKSALRLLFPHIFAKLKRATHLEEDLNELVREILKMRVNKPSGRNDFMDLMLECRERGAIVGESLERRKPDGTPEEARLEFNDGLIAAQVLLFFAAGFEATSSAMSFTLHQLAFNQDVQKKSQDEVDRALAAHNGTLSYDAVKEMSYLECVFKEGMRMFPSAGILLRQSTKPYTFSELGLTIDKETLIMIPLQSIHNDPKYFRDPEQFRPERFSGEEFSSIKKNAYLPFGAGPRACIGERLGLMLSLAGVAAILSAFTVSPAPESRRCPIVDPKYNLIQSVRGGLPLRFEARRPKNGKIA